MVDDVSSEAVGRLARDGFEPRVVVETSPANFQAWITLTDAESVPYPTMIAVARYLTKTYDGDERAVSPRQPGRLPGFTNRKPKHQQNGVFPFVRLTFAEKDRVATKGVALIEKLLTFDTGRAAAGAAPETPLAAAVTLAESDPEIAAWLDVMHDQQRVRIMREFSAGHRPATATSRSEVDFAVAVTALQSGIANEVVVAWMTSRRRDKDPVYARRTVEAASDRVGPAHQVLRR